MTYDRSSKVIQIGRICQEYSKYLGFLDYPVRLCSRPITKPVIVIVAPPRSGSTLTYQLLTTGIKNFYLTNIWNLFYATPTLGGIISQRLCRNYQSNFTSNHGFVLGACGEAEGLKFWSYWSGQALREESKIDEKRLKTLAKVIQRLGESDTAFISGYLGHVFCMNELRAAFPKIIFVHLARDLLANAYSLFKLSRQKWFSTQPKEYADLQKLPREQQVVKQVTLIHQRISDQSNSHDTIRISYHEVCQNPTKVIDQVIDFAEANNINLYREKKKSIPKEFPESRVEYDLNQDTLKIHQYIEKLSNKAPSLNRIFV